MFKKKLMQKQKTHVITNEPDDITLELAKTLAEIKDDYDLPTEEVANTVSTKNNSRFRNIFKKILDSQAFKGYNLHMLEEIKTTCKLRRPLVTSMGLSYDIIIKSTAAKFLAFSSAEEAAQAMYDAIEDSLTTGNEWEDRRKFWEDDIKEMTSIDKEFSISVATVYFKLVFKTYGMPKP